MKIEVNSPTVNLQPVDKGAKKVSTASVTDAQGATQDRTTLRTDTLSLQSLTSQALNSPEIRQDRVSALSQSVKNGDYKIDSTKTAEAIITSKDL